MRGPRISYPHAVYHVINRFVDKHPFFQTTGDYRYFLQVFRETASTFGVLTYAYALMPNHFHLLIETTKPNISKFLQRFLSPVVGSMNRRRARVGHLMQGRSKTILIDTDSYFQTAFAYVLLNPVRAGLTHDAFAFPWTSANDMLAEKPVFIDREKLWAYLWPEDERGPHDTQRLKKWLMAQDGEKVKCRFIDGHRGSFLGSEEFRNRILAKTERRVTPGEGGRRKSDARLPVFSYKQVMRCVKHYVRDNETVAGCWQSSEKAIRDLAWYTLFNLAGWSWERIRKREKLGAIAQSRLSMVLTRIRRDQAKLKVAEEIMKDLRSE